MSTIDNVSLWQIVLTRMGRSALARKEAKAKAREANPTALTLFQSFVRVLLHIGGFGCLTYAGFMWHIVAGLVVAGISCFAFSTLIVPSHPPQK